MDNTNTSGEIKIEWLDYEKYGVNIKDIRRKVFVEEQGFNDFMISHPKDDAGLHLGAFYENKLYSVISSYIYSKQDREFIEEMHLPPFENQILQLSRRTQILENGSKRIAEYLAAALWKEIVDTTQPDYIFIGLYGIHKRLATYYKSFGFMPYKVVKTKYGELSIYIQSSENIHDYYPKIRKLIRRGHSHLGISPPSLIHFLADINRLEVFNIDKLKKQNLYLDKLSFKDEIPRLVAQAKLLFLTQKSILGTTSFPDPHAKFIDIGCGPGVYLSFLTSHPRFAEYEFTAIDESQDMINYAKIFHKKINLKAENVYSLTFENSSFDIVHCSFLFIHLQTPNLALRNIFRILKPDGLFYVVDVNDSTFKGPSKIKEMVMKHSQIYEGNRNILNELPELAHRNKFLLKEVHTVDVENTGYEDRPVYEGGTLKLGKITMWAMFTFISQRSDMREIFQNAEKYYFANDCKIEIQIQTQIYKKSQTPNQISAE
ncbi:MAG: class I SAM-dependent methyltransferase [Bacteroidales bacterium]|nr:class I SAM-dependent methyltransferase [Bacteroidales bacterium]